MNNQISQSNEKLKILLDSDLCKFSFNFESKNTVVFDAENLIEVMSIFNENEKLKFEILIDIIAVDYSDYGISEWNAQNANNKGYSRGIKKDSSGRYTYETAKKNHNQPKKRFAAIYNLLSISSNLRLNVKFYCNEDDVPSLPTVTSIWSSADWYEREAYDLLGIVFTDHPDLRRLLTDYGFIGHPLRKDFPLIGNVEVNYDLDKERVVYQPVTIKPRVLIPKVIRGNGKKEESNG
ncbi:MAG: NADH-quinone oxidoreductase subunit C [Gammaproteobacteria bacterium]|nr:NADH-quinone oxidoreductase subunit C [Gammaproteobacteria bacterium]